MNETILKKEIHECLLKYFGYTAFRPGQYEVIESLLMGIPTMAVMPTGGGKSICYQIPALLLPGVTIVVSPLISLMKDQVDKLIQKKIPAALINSTLSLNQVGEVLDLCRQGRIKLLYIAPERFHSTMFKEAFSTISVSLFAVDEAHCISQWGHDFRPSYLRMNYAVRLLGSPVVGAFTATATPEVREDIVKQLELKNPRVVIRGFDRPNIRYLTLSLKEKEKEKEVVDILRKFKVSTIIYCSTKKSTDKLREHLQYHGVRCESYHAGMDPRMRDQVQEWFITGKLPVIIATNAFGMGIDKPDIRLIVHYNLPGSLEAFYQESGRAGRDGQVSYSMLMGNTRDVKIQEYLVNCSFPTEKAIRSVCAYLFERPENPVLQTYSEITEAIGGELNEMMVGNIIKILESSHLVKRLKERDHPAYLNFRIPFDRFYQRNRNFMGRRVLMSYFEKIFQEITPGRNLAFSPEQLLNALHLSREQFARHMKSMSSAGDLVYIPPFSGAGIEKIIASPDPENIPVDFRELEASRQRQLSKLWAVNDYLTVKTCKRAFLLQYFGEKYPHSSCKGCDVCLNWRPERDNAEAEKKEAVQTRGESARPARKEIPSLEGQMLTPRDIKLFYCALVKYNNKLGILKLIGLLRGGRTADLMRAKLFECPFYGTLKHSSQEMLKAFIEEERKAGRIKRSRSKRFPKLLLTEKGKEKVKLLLAGN